MAHELQVRTLLPASGLRAEWKDRDMAATVVRVAGPAGGWEMVFSDVHGDVGWIKRLAERGNRLGIDTLVSVGDSILEKTRRLAHGLRTFEHYRLRIMPAASSTRPRRPTTLESEERRILLTNAAKIAA